MKTKRTLMKNSLRQWKVLIVDDNLLDAMKPFQLLMNLGDQVTLCLDARDGLIENEIDAYDLIILDMMMPEISGLEFLRRLLHSSSTDRQVKVAIYSGSSFDPSIIPSGVSQFEILGVWNKKLSPSELLKKIKDLKEADNHSSSISNSMIYSK